MRKYSTCLAYNIVHLLFSIGLCMDWLISHWLNRVMSWAILRYSADGGGQRWLSGNGLPSKNMARNLFCSLSVLLFLLSVVDLSWHLKTFDGLGLFYLDIDMFSLELSLIPSGMRNVTCTVFRWHVQCITTLWAVFVSVLAIHNL